MNSACANIDSQALRLGELCELPSDDRRTVYLQEHPELVASQSVEKLAEVVRQRVRSDVTRALHAADSAILIAQALESRECLARAFRAKGNALWFKGECRLASQFMTQAIQVFEELALDDELARTLSTSIQPLILVGDYELALRHAERARDIFTRHQNDLRLARLDINVANIHHRQAHYAEALAVYSRAYQRLLACRDVEAIGVVLHNIAVCLICLDDFEGALKTYSEVRHFLETHEMPLLAAQADYNIAHLYYLRGDYGRALDGLRAARDVTSKAGDGYHAALCDLDQSEICLELNLVEDAEAMAKSALAQFERLGMGYEMARALTNLAIAKTQGRQELRAMELFDRARAMFAKEGHKAGEALIDLYQAVLLAESGELVAARRCGLRARHVFRALGLRRKAIVCDLLVARVAFDAGELEVARELCGDALYQLANVQAPVLAYRAHLLSGCIYERLGDGDRGGAEYEAARKELEKVRGSLEREEIKIAFMSNRLEVYERLILLCLQRGGMGLPADEAFEHMERAKCRSLFDAMFDRVHPMLPRSISHEDQQQIQNLRAQLNWYHRRIDMEELQQDGTAAERVDHLWEQARRCEDALLSMRELPATGGAENNGYCPAAVTLAEIRATLEPSTVLLEYFHTRDQLLAAVLNRDGVHLVALGPAQPARNQFRMLQLHLSKFRLGPSYIDAVGEVLFSAARQHLQALYKQLVEPLQHLLNGRHLVVVPSGFLHYLPMHALHDGQEYLIDRFTLSYAPSASVYALTQRRAVNGHESSLILGVPDAKTPWILGEVDEVFQAVPNASRFLGPDASREVLDQRGGQSRLIHIATHGHFRTDNPMFSSVRLGNSHLSVYDLYNLHLPVELLTLSGCGTGLNVVAVGDEPIGLARGLLYAGAQSLLLTLWDVHDQSTAEFMRGFYRRFSTGLPKATALQTAMQEIRDRYPHPYYWAPFMLVGKAA